MRNHLVILAAAPPGRYSGHAVALETTLTCIARKFDRVSYISALADATDVRDLPNGFENVTYHSLGIRRPPRFRRVMRSYVSHWPAICQQYVTASARSAWSETLAQVSARGEHMLVLVEHVPLAALAMTEICGSERDWKVLVRSHDVLYDAFKLFSTEGRWRLLWRHELRKICSLERKVSDVADHFSAISSFDKRRYFELYGQSCDSVLGVAVDLERYARTPHGDEATVVHIGGCDIRKAHGLQKLTRDVWPKIRQTVPGAKLVLAGKNSEVFSDQSNGVVGCGPVDDDRTVLAMGQTFVNPQEAGSGIKIKSLHAMAAGKALVTTENGVSGIPVVNGRECLVAADVASLGDALVSALQRVSLRAELARRGRQLVSSQYSISTIAESYEEMLDIMMFGGRHRQ